MKNDRADMLAAYVVHAGLSVAETRALTVREANAITEALKARTI